MRKRKGLAIPIVLLFVVVTVTYLTMSSSTRSRVKKQNLASHTQKQAYYMALGGIQHALLKLRILQRQAYDAAALARGVCPFFNMVGSKIMSTLDSGSLPKKCSSALDIFVSDLNSDVVPITIDEEKFRSSTPEAQRWRYKVSKFEVLSYHTATGTTDYGTIRITLNVESKGFVYDIRDSVNTRQEVITKKVVLERKLGS